LRWCVVATQDGQGIAAELCAGAVRGRIGGGLFHNLCGALHRESKVISSAVLDGTLLLAWAGFMVWVADRKKSEVLALFAVSLAYYASVITPVGSFTLFSNLVLTIAAVFFLVRNRWAGLSWASLVATYAAYAYWRFYHGEGWCWPEANEGLWLGASFLWGYWLVHRGSIPVRHEGVAGERRAAFLTFNNAPCLPIHNDDDPCEHGQAVAILYRLRRGSARAGGCRGKFSPANR
jgi:hypothetical protein